MLSKDFHSSSLLCLVMLRSTAEREIHYPIPVIEGINTSPLCFAAQNLGERQRSDSDEERGWKIACYILKA